MKKNKTIILTLFSALVLNFPLVADGLSLNLTKEQQAKIAYLKDEIMRKFQQDVRGLNINSPQYKELWCKEDCDLKHVYCSVTCKENNPCMQNCKIAYDGCMDHYNQHSD